jgi:hypothetical protein
MVARFRPLWEPLGEWRTQLLFRLYALCRFNFCLIKYASLDLGRLNWTADWHFHGMAACALALLAAGPRLALIALDFAWTLVCFGVLLWGGSDLMSFPAAEWTIFLLVSFFGSGVPVVAMIRALRSTESDEVAAARYRAEVDWGMTAVFRLLAACVLGFAALHKLNSDFFDLSVSCISLERRLSEWWGLPAAAYAWIGPVHVVALEALAPVLLFTVPWLGIPLTVLMVSMFASIGAPAFAGLVMTMTLAFLPHAAHDGLMRRARRCWPFMAASGLVVLASGLAYRASFPWPPIAVGQLLAVFVLWCGLFFAHEVWSRHRAELAMTEDPQAPRPSPGMRGFITAAAVIALLNGLTPYLGLKFQYSFAMLSNLRVDDARWNSLVFPRAVRLTPHDGYLHVSRARYKKLPDGPVFDEADLLDPGLYSPSAVRYVLARSIESGVQISLDFDYLGQSYRFVDGDPNALYAFAATLPETPLIQKKLDGAQPQSCFH